MRVGGISTLLVAALASGGAVLVGPVAAEAHTYGAYGAGMAGGMAHPLGGLDHQLAMIAVGVWAAQMGRRARWCVPAAFVAVMALAGGVAAGGPPTPFVEVGIAGSVLALGVFIALALKPPVALGMAIVGALAVFHGVAHGAELPQAAAPWAYALGFVSATALLHALGVGFGHVMQQRGRAAAFRWSGAAIAATGAGLLVF